jgi:thymidylate synthase
MNTKITHIDATTISDAWFQLLSEVLNDDNIYIQHIQRGSYAEDGKGSGQYRRQFYGVSVSIMHPDQDIVPIMPASLGVPPPTDMDYINDYFLNYLMRATLKPTEQYTYGQRIAISLDEVIRMLCETPFTNQANLQIGEPSDVYLSDPPCLRIMDLKVIPGKYILPYEEYKSWSKDSLPNVLTMSVYFRSWDLWSGFCANLGGFELLKQLIASETGLENGPMYAYSAGMHIYGMTEDIARIRTCRIQVAK